MLAHVHVKARAERQVPSFRACDSGLSHELDALSHLDEAGPSLLHIARDIGSTQPHLAFFFFKYAFCGFELRILSLLTTLTHRALPSANWAKEV